ncbi:MAG: NEW3 domain-containing protein [Betaproteobacteria bacterium]
MSYNKQIISLAIILAALALLIVAVPAPTLAEAGYQTIYNDFAYSGTAVHPDGCTVISTIHNNSSAVTITVSRIGYDDVTGTIEPGSVMNLDDFMIQVVPGGVDHDGNRVFLKILKWQSGSPTSTGAGLSCSVPGQRALGGDRVTFPITIQNHDAEGHTYTLGASSDTGWTLSFASAGKDVYKLFVPGQQSVTVDLVVQTTAGAGIGEKRVTAKVDSATYDLFVYITNVNESASVSYDVSSKIASIGDKIYYSLKIKNLQPQENIYRLSASGLPDNWYYRYKTDPSSQEDLAEVVLAPNAERNLVIEIVPPYSVSAGDYNFAASVITPEGSTISKDLMLRLKSSVSMEMITGKLAYDAKPGEAFNIDVYVQNTGNGAALTNVYLETKAPDGWTVQVTPNKTASLTAGNSQAFRVKVTPPGNIVPSDYDVAITARSDQAEKEKSFRITVTVDSLVPYIGGGIILFVVVGLLLVYRKYGRR